MFCTRQRIDAAGRMPGQSVSRGELCGFGRRGLQAFDWWRE